MPRISRHKDRARTGHLCSPSAPVNASQSTVFANGKRVLVRGNKLAKHFIKFDDYCISHSAKLKGSSSSVFVGNIGVGRKGDSADKGAMKGASPDVFAG